MSDDKHLAQYQENEYQKDLHNAKQQIEERWNAFYMKKEYVGTRQMQNQARANDNAEKQRKIIEELSKAQNTLDKAHFGEKGRDSVLAQLSKTNNPQQQQERTQQIKNELEKQSGRDNSRSMEDA